MRMKRIINSVLVVLTGLGLSACSNIPTDVDFSGIESVCELATLKCYYHNVAKAETEASGLFKWLGTGYKKMWVEYSGIVELGIDVNKVSVSEPDDKGRVEITIPDAEILNIDLDEESMQEPLTETGLFTEITKEEETAALAEAQDDMKKTAQENEALLSQAKERAKNLIEGYVKNVGDQVGKEYSVIWIDASK